MKKIFIIAYIGLCALVIFGCQKNYKLISKENICAIISNQDIVDTFNYKVKDTEADESSNSISCKYSSPDFFEGTTIENTPDAVPPAGYKGGIEYTAVTIEKLLSVKSIEEIQKPQTYGGDVSFSKKWENNVGVGDNSAITISKNPELYFKLGDSIYRIASSGTSTAVIQITKEQLITLAKKFINNLAMQ